MLYQLSYSRNGAEDSNRGAGLQRPRPGPALT